MIKNKKEKQTIKLPKTIYVIRHGEKPNDDKKIDLSVHGFSRSKYLINYWNNQNVPNPDIIYCFKNNNGIQNRSYELMEPLNKQYNIPINCDFRDKKDESKMVEHVLTKNEDKIVLICWEHENIPLVINLIYGYISKENIMSEKFKYWALNTEQGIINKSKHDNDSELYSLTIMIDPLTRLLTGISQSDKFENNILLDEPIKILFTIQG